MVSSPSSSTTSDEQVTDLNDTPRGHYFLGRRWAFPWEDVAHLLGNAPDVEIAATLGCTTLAVRQMRKRLDIPRFRKTDRVRALAGRHTDKVVAEMVGCSRETVTRLRSRERIPACPASRRQNMLKPDFERWKARHKERRKHGPNLRIR